MNKVTINETKRPKEGQFYKHCDEDVYIVAAIDGSSNLKLICLNDGLVWDSESVWGGAEDNFSLINSTIIIEPHNSFNIKP